ncbi:4'-phosphopantetheine phosphatase-like [Watersipora subatra]|uniref:4'-phosphopantetheine phosphatase-like n=1 Tax=Watersipora subatra TaxID=2589382 RepID=UPI00355B9C76
MAGETDTSYTVKSLELPAILSNVKQARRFAIDIGGSLAKLAYSSSCKKKATIVSENPAHQSIYKVTEVEEDTELLNFVKFETKYISSCLSFIKENLLTLEPHLMAGKTVKVTGGGAFKYKDLITETLGCQIDKEDEIDCLVRGCNFLLKSISDESFIYQAEQKAGQSRFKFLPTDADIFPYLLVNIGSGVSILKVESETKYSRVGGTCMGGGTFWGLGTRLTGVSSFDELINLASTGNNKNVDLLVKDIYGGEGAASLGLSNDVLACSFGKVTKPAEVDYSPADMAQSLLFCISYDIAQIACLQAEVHSIQRMYFGGFFIRGHSLTMDAISYAINYWAKGKVKAMFLRHEGYLGAIGAYLKGADEEDIVSYSWGESYPASSGLLSPRATCTNSFEAFQISRHPTALVKFPFLADPGNYNPDVVDLTQDGDAREYWLACFTDSLPKFTQKAIESQDLVAGAKERAELFKAEYLSILSNLSENPTAYGSLTVRSLLDMREQCLHNAHFTDIYLKDKQQENEQCLVLFKDRINQLDQLDVYERWIQLARGVLAGNLFDWGAAAVVRMLEAGELSFDVALSKLQGRPWLHDDLDSFLSRITSGPNYKCVAIFCDNSGADIILGIIPFAREFLKRNTKVILCANSKPVVNDVTHTELNILVSKLAVTCPVISKATQSQDLMVMETGQASPCLDLRYVNEDLCTLLQMQKADLLVIEGMGRAVHTNLYTKHTCDSLKVACIKNKRLAERLGGQMYGVVFKFELASEF